MTVAKDGPRTSGPDVGRGTPQSGIPTQGGPRNSAPNRPFGPRPSGPFPASHPSMGPPSRPLAVDAPTSLVAPPTSAPTRLGSRSTLRWVVVGVLAALQVFVLFSAVMWWIGGTAHTSAVASVAPMSWTGVVYDVGNAGVNLRADSKVDPANSRDTAMRGSRLALSCGQTGDVVHKGDVSTATWLKTTDGLFVSMLYVRVPDRQSIPSCDGSKVDGPLLALADPANPQLPPPPGTQIGSAGGSASSRGAATPAGGAVVAAPGAVAPPAQGAQATAHGSSGVVIASDVPDTAANSGTTPDPSHPNTPAPQGGGSVTAPTGSQPGQGRAVAARPPSNNPDTTPVG